MVSNHRLLRDAYARAPRPRSMGEGRSLFCRRLDGATVPVDVALSPMSLPEGPGVIAVLRDATERQAQDERMRYLGTHDLLTGLSNRAFLEDTLARLTAGRQVATSLWPSCQGPTRRWEG
jgi:hypothetical protein